MSLILEDGTGVSDANAYTTVDEVTAYLTDRQRQAEGGWESTSLVHREAAVIAATDYIDQRWGDQFLGNKEFRDVSAARATLTLTAIPLDTETVTIGPVVYTFNTVLGGANSVLIGVSVAASILNLRNAVSATPGDAGMTHGVGTTANSAATAEEGVGDTMIAEAKEKGTAGNSVMTTTTVTGATWSSATLVGGGDVPEAQALEFPRINLYDREGIQVRGIPRRVKQATAEYAVRAVVASLTPDPVTDDSGKTVVRKREKVGPIEEETQYEEGGALSRLIKPYPAADRLLSQYVVPGGRVFRG